MKLAKLYHQYKSDIETVAKYYNVDITKLVPPREKGCHAIWTLFKEARANRAYDDSHPRWQTRKRVLPYDGSDYCEFYIDQRTNDSHVETLLKKIYNDIVKERNTRK